MYEMLIIYYRIIIKYSKIMVRDHATHTHTNLTSENVSMGREQKLIEFNEKCIEVTFL